MPKEKEEGKKRKRKKKKKTTINNRKSKNRKSGQYRTVCTTRVYSPRAAKIPI